MRCGFAIVLAFLVVVPMLAAGGQSSHTSSRQPWEYSDDERIAMRTNRDLAANRARVATETPGQRRSSRYTDIIVGRRHPELFLRTELFETMVMDGYVRYGWREFYVKRISSAGLPSDFWQQLRSVAAPYLGDLEAQNELLEAGKEHPEQRQALEARIAAGYATLCRDRLEALKRARVKFGPALDRLLYDYVAAKTTLYIDDFESADRLRSESRGCQ